MSVLIKKQAVIAPLNGALELLLERDGENVVLTAKFDANTESKAVVLWRNLWTYTFMPDKAKKTRDSRVNTIQKMFKSGKTPSTLNLHFAPVGNFEIVAIGTGDLRKALLALK